MALATVTLVTILANLTHDNRHSENHYFGWMAYVDENSDNSIIEIDRQVSELASH